MKKSSKCLWKDILQILFTLLVHCYENLMITCVFPDNKVHGSNMGSTWVLSAPGGPHVGPMNLAIRVLPTRHQLCRALWLSFSTYTVYWTNSFLPVVWVAMAHMQHHSNVMMLMGYHCNEKCGTSYDLCVVSPSRTQYRNISNIRCTKFPNLNVSHLVLQLPLPNPFKPSVKWIMKM